MSFMEIFFGKRKTPIDVLRENLQDLRKIEREAERFASEAQRAMHRKETDIENLVDDATTFAECYDEVRIATIEKIQHRARMVAYKTQAAKVRDLQTKLKVQELDVRMQHDALRSAGAIIRFGRSLPSVQQLKHLLVGYELSSARQTIIRDEIGGAIGDATDDALDGDEDSGLSGLNKDALESEVEKEMNLLRIAAGEDMDAALEALPRVPTAIGSGKGKVKVSVSSKGPARTDDDSDGESESES